MWVCEVSHVYLCHHLDQKSLSHCISLVPRTWFYFSALVIVNWIVQCVSCIFLTCLVIMLLPLFGSISIINRQNFMIICTIDYLILGQLKVSMYLVNIRDLTPSDYNVINYLVW